MSSVQSHAFAPRAVARGADDVAAIINWALTHDLCPAAAPWERWAKRPVVLLSAMLPMAIALAALANPVTASAALALVAVIAVGRAWPALTIRGVTAEMRFAGRRGVEGEVAPVVVTVRNAWPWPAWGISIEADIGGRERVSLAHLPPCSTTEFRWECVPRCRGEFPRGPAEIVTAFPFGLVVARRTIRVDRAIVIWPATVPLDSLLDVADAAAAEEAVGDQRAGDAGDVIGTRPFRQGDPLRRVHWTLTARTGALVACERQAPRAAAVRVVVDADPTSHDDDGPTGTFENALRVAASICRSYHDRRAGVECWLGGERLDVSTGQRGLTRFLDALARSSPADGGRPAGAREAATTHRRPRAAAGSLQITITTPRGLAALAGRPSGGDGTWIVIDSGAGPAGPAPRSSSPDRVVRLGCGADTLGEFSRRWEGLRHAG